MNRFLTHEGRQPVWLNDIEFIQDSVNSEVLKIVEGLTGGIKDKVIISGCDISDYGDEISEGIILYNGKLYRVNAATFEQVYDDDNIYYVEFGDGYDITGDRQLKESAEIVHCYYKPWASFNNKRRGIPLSEFTKINSVIISRKVHSDNGASANIQLVKHNTQYFLSVEFNGKFKDAIISFSNYDVVRDLAMSQEDHNHSSLPYYGIGGIVKKNSTTGSVDYGFVNAIASLHYLDTLRVKLDVSIKGPYVNSMDTSDDKFSGGFTMTLLPRN